MSRLAFGNASAGDARQGDVVVDRCLPHCRGWCRWKSSQILSTSVRSGLYTSRALGLTVVRRSLIIQSLPHKVGDVFSMRARHAGMGCGGDSARSSSVLAVVLKPSPLLGHLPCCPQRPRHFYCATRGLGPGGPDAFTTHTYNHASSGWHRIPREHSSTNTICIHISTYMASFET